MDRCVKSVTIGLILILISSVVQAGSANPVEFIDHDLNLQFDVSNHSATITDAGLLRTVAGHNIIALNPAAVVDAFQIGGDKIDYFVYESSDTANIKSRISGSYPELELDGSPRLLIFSTDQDREIAFSISYCAEIFQDAANTRFSREAVGSEISGTIGEQGAYLSPAAYYYPRGREEHSLFRVTSVVPESWEAISDGNQLSTKTENGLKTQTFANEFVSDGNSFMAAPFVVETDTVDGIEIACLFFAEDTALIADYMSATSGYIQMYTELIGPYPFKRFSVVENFFPTGYGMPAWTLLGQQVIRLPFIKYTSLGHEVLHNWWGNSVYVDYTRGNWCESATVYGADYRYKLMQNENAARDYRKDILKEYVSYVSESNDFPIREFQSRTSPNTRTIGYNKAMMVWHMLEEEIGSEPFWQAWKLINERYQAQAISWEEWIAVLEETSGGDLSHIIPQWIDRAGAPEIALVNTIYVRDGRGGDVAPKNWMGLVLSQNSDEPYLLNIPIRYKDQEGIHDTVFLLSDSTGECRIPYDGLEYVEIDPDYHLFRKLYPEEVEPIVSAVTGSEQQLLACDTDSPELREAFHSMGRNMFSDDITMNSTAELQTAEPKTAPVVLNPEPLPQYLTGFVEFSGDSVMINDTWYPRAGHTFILTGDKWGNAGKYMVVISDDTESLPRVGQLVPHYGKYSYLVFEGSTNVGKGQWPVKNSPLKKSLTM